MFQFHEISAKHNFFLLKSESKERPLCVIIGHFLKRPFFLITISAKHIFFLGGGGPGGGVTTSNYEELRILGHFSMDNYRRGLPINKIMRNNQEILGLDNFYFWAYFTTFYNINLNQKCQ